MQITQDVSGRIKTIRKVKKLTQQQMADKLGITKNHYHLIESGNYDFKINYAQKIAEILDISYRILFEK